MELDLGRFSSCRAFAQAFKAKGIPLHYLINNAGIMALKEKTFTEDGFEAQFATNHLGHFIVTILLAPVLVSSAPSRVVQVSSVGHKRYCPTIDVFNTAFSSFFFARSLCKSTALSL